MGTEPKTKRVIITVENCHLFKNKWFRLLNLTNEHLKAHPKDEKLIGRRFKVLNRAFFVEDINGVVNVFKYGAKCEFLC